MGKKLLRRNTAVSDNTQNRKVQPLQIIKPQLQEKKVSVQVPTAGGGFVTMWVPESQAKKYAQNNKEEYNPAYQESKALEQSRLKEFFTEEYIKKLLGGLLTGTPILLNNKNNQ